MDGYYIMGDPKYYAFTVDDDCVVSISQPDSAPNPMPDEVTALRDRFDKACTKIRQTVVNSVRRKDYIDKLIGYGKLAFETGDLRSASLALDGLQRDFVLDEGPSIRKKHIITTLQTSFAIATPAFIATLLMPSIQEYSTWIDTNHSIIMAVLYIAIGNCLGISFFAFTKNLTLTFESIGNFDPANLDQQLRFGLVAIVTLIFSILIKSNVITVGLGGLNLDKFIENSFAAVVLGIICGYSDTVITAMLSKALDQPTQKAN